MAIYTTGSSGTLGRHFSARAIAINRDFLSIDYIERLPKFAEHDSLVHLGGIVGNEAVENDPSRAHKVNVEATLRLAENFLSQNGSRFIFISSSHVYAPSAEKLNENSPLKPQSRYASQKIEAENLLQKLFSKKPEKLCVVRVFSVLDWDVAPFTLGGAIAKLAFEDPNFHLKNASDIRDFLTPRTIASALERIAECVEITGVVNLCSGTGTSVAEATRIMLKSRNLGVPEDRIVPGNSPNPYIVGDNTRLVKALPGLDLVWRPSGIPEI